MDKFPSLIEILKKFDAEEKCIKYFEQIRWPQGPVCIKCGSSRVMQFKALGKTKKVRHLYECKDCHFQYSVTAGTVFHNSHLPLTKWFLAIYLICSSKKGVAAKQLQRQLSIGYEAAWYMAHRIRLAMQEDEDFCQKFAGICEVDETYIGGKSKGPRGRGAANKTPVVAMKERTSGKILMQAVDNVKISTLANFIRKHAAPGAEIHTDEFKSYWWIDASEFVHNTVPHKETYVKAGNIHVNGIENVWSLFKRAITGVFHKVSAKYLPLYLNEFAFRFNNREKFNIMDEVLKTSF